MFIKEKSLAEIQYPTLNWKRIWDNYLSTFIYPSDKEIIYKHLHMCLATNKKLFIMNLINSSTCEKCTDGLEQTSLHMFYQCSYIKPLFLWIINCLLKICKFKPLSPIRFLYFDNMYTDSRQKNICNIFLYMYIVTIWKTRKENLRIGNLKNMIIRNLNEYQIFIKHITTHRSEKISKDFANINIDDMINF